MNSSFEKHQVYKACIKKMLENEEEINIEDDELSKMVFSLMEKKSIEAGADYKLPKELCFLLGSSYLHNKKIVEDQMKKLPLDVELVVLVDSIAEKLQLRIPRRVQARIKYARNSLKDEFAIGIDTRLNSLTIASPTKKAVYPTGQIFVAKLYDLVELYNEIGDSLFEKNVRYSISKDKTEVETSIHGTLEKEPENFWFFNNGITLLADRVDCSDDKSIRIISSEENSFSVINGAQTLTACADYFYDATRTDAELTKAKNAYVLLRVITVFRSEEGKVDEKRNLENKISVSLNRQKPIDAEDLAINSDVVSTINNLSVGEAFDFKICRKGDEDVNNVDAFLLSDVGRLVLASRLQKPGAAKNAYKAYLLKMDGDSFKKKDVFPSFKRKDVEKLFIEQYGLVKISAMLYSALSNEKEMISDLDIQTMGHLKQLFENGQFYFVAIVVRALFVDTYGKAENKINRARIELVYNRLNGEKIKSILTCYKRMVINSLPEDEKVEYSSLKGEAIYEKLYNSQYYGTFMNDVVKIVFSPKDLMTIKEKGI